MEAPLTKCESRLAAQRLYREGYSAASAADMIRKSPVFVSQMVWLAGQPPELTNAWDEGRLTQAAIDDLRRMQSRVSHRLDTQAQYDALYARTLNPGQ